MSKEHDVESGYDWLEARGYDARIGRFVSIDPYVELYPSNSSYSYSANNPIVNSDPSGRIIINGANIVLDPVYVYANALATYVLSVDWTMVGASTLGGAASILAFTSTCLAGDNNNPAWFAQQKGEQAKAEQKPKTSINQVKQKIQKGQAPKTIDRADAEDPNVNEKDHIHFKDGAELNSDGSWKKNPRPLTNTEKGFLKEIGWTIPN